MRHWVAISIALLLAAAVGWAVLYYTSSPDIGKNPPQSPRYDQRVQTP